jgi:hypothetical protein
VKIGPFRIRLSHRSRHAQFQRSGLEPRGCNAPVEVLELGVCRAGQTQIPEKSMRVAEGLGELGKVARPPGHLQFL